jgi:2-polyprenyl-3-methyl-5-hydroxy-6-metoxy-1,4-benzoquinol methylase
METQLVYGRNIALSGLAVSHRLMLDEVPDGSRVLDVGCASGYLAEPLSRRGCSVVGFERDPASAAAAREHCDEMIVGDIENPDDRARIAPGFDAILLGDVLEHLLDPWGALRYLHSLVAPDGIVVASIPNVAAWTVRLRLLRGEFEYTESGLLDRTHLRFFTRATAHELVLGAGFAIERERFTPILQPPGRISRAMRGAFPRAADVAVRAARRVWPELMAQQFVFRLRPRA